MNVAVLRSIKPYWVYLICEGKKTIEVGKNKPRSEHWNNRTHIYCSKDLKSFNRIPKEYREKYRPLLGKVIGEFICDFIIGQCEMANADIAEQRGCIKRETLLEYSNGKELFGWHISNFTIYTNLKTINDFNLSRPPQTWCYVRN